jgi:hypothetical protein
MPAAASTTPTPTTAETLRDGVEVLNGDRGLAEVASPDAFGLPPVWVVSLHSTDAYMTTWLLLSRAGYARLLCTLYELAEMQVFNKLCPRGT